MEKKSTDYCFKGCEEFQKYCNNKNYSVSGNLFDCYYYNSSNTLEPSEWDCSSRSRGRVEITWQEFKQLFIDKTMTTQEEINELKTRLQELEEKVKKENEFKVGDLVVVLPEDTHYYNSAQGKAQEIVEVRPFLLPYVLPYVLSFADGSTNSYRLIRKATQAEINEYLAKNKPIEISGYKAEFNKKDKTVSFGCKKDITIEDLKAVLTVMKLVDKFTVHFNISSTLLWQDKSMLCTDFGGISKETIEKLINKLEE